MSTAPDEDCGGQANGKDSKGRPFVIYEIEYPSLNVMQVGGVRPAVPGDFPHTGMFPKVPHRRRQPRRVECHRAIDDG